MEELVDSSIIPTFPFSIVPHIRVVGFLPLASCAFQIITKVR